MNRYTHYGVLAPVRLRRIRSWLFLAVLCTCVAAGLGLWLNLPSHGSEVLTAGADQSPPYTFWGSDGKVRGFAAEIVEEAARRKGYTLKWIKTEVREGGCDAAIRGGRVDLCPAVGRIASRTRDFHISRPFLRNDFCLLSDLRRPVNSESGGDLALSLVNGPVTKERAAALFPNARHLLANSRVAAGQALCRGESSATLIETRLLQQILMRRPAGCEGVDFANRILRDAAVELGIAGPRANARILDELRDEIDALRVSGFFGRSVEQWQPLAVGDTELLFREQEARWRISMLWQGAIGAGLLVLILVVLNRRIAAARKVAVQAAAAKSEFIANLSHEIRTPLSGVLSTTELLLEHRMDSDVRRYVEIIRDSGRMLLQLVSDLLDIKKIEAGRLDLETEPCRLSELLAGVVDSFQSQATRQGIGLKLNVAQEVPEFVLCDALRLRQVVCNLVGNALKFTEKGEVVIDAVWRKGLRLEVMDTGIGIAPETAGRLFDKFVQADSSITKRFGGTGLGLALSKAIVEAMGGRIGVESRLGSGSRFWVEVPLAECEAKPEIRLAAEVVSLAALSRSVLLAEDNKTNQFVARRLLERIGCEVDVVNNGEEAVRRAGQRHYDAVFMDCFMPVLDGYEATRRIRQLGGEEGQVPIIALSAAAMDTERQRALDAGMNDYVTKPVSRDALVRALERWTSRPE